MDSSRRNAYIRQPEQSSSEHTGSQHDQDDSLTDELESNSDRQARDISHRAEYLDSVTFKHKSYLRNYERGPINESTFHVGDDLADPFTEDESEAHRSAAPHTQICDNLMAWEDARKASATSSTLLPELEMPGAYRSSSSQGEYLMPLTQHRTQSVFSRSSQRPRNKGLLDDSPDGRFASPAASRDLLSSPRSPLSEHHRPSVFCNSSSAHSIKLSSPSPTPLPFANSPRSARHRPSANSRVGTPSIHLQADADPQPRQGTPTPSPLSRHSNPAKEYPLVLLHCSIKPLKLHYSENTLKAVLSTWVLDDITLLREKLHPIVLERGILISHPGDDYELLEERVLESLELRKPRVGKCGHFLGEKMAIGEQGPRQDTYQADASGIDAHLNQHCPTCSRHISIDHLKDSPVADPIGRPGRWDLKIFAANGLLRAGAWSNAWREMEKVDIEIGVWIPDDMLRALEQEAEVELNRERESVLEVVAEYGQDATAISDVDGTRQHVFRDRDWIRRRKISASTIIGANGMKMEERDRKSGVTDASTAAFSKVGTKRTQRDGNEHPPRKDVQSDDGRTPLGSLLSRYIEKKIRGRPDVAIILTIFAAALYLWTTTGSASISIHEATQLEKKLIFNPLASSSQSGLPICAFHPTQAHEQGMMALPADIASKVLAVIAAASAPASASGSPHVQVLDDAEGNCDVGVRDGAKEKEAQIKGVFRGILDTAQQVVKMDHEDDLLV